MVCNTRTYKKDVLIGTAPTMAKNLRKTPLTASELNKIMDGWQYAWMKGRTPLRHREYSWRAAVFDALPALTRPDPIDTTVI